MMPKLAGAEYCTGCTACASVCPRQCITMEADRNGFLFPRINKKMCIRCGLCEKTCPVLHLPELHQDLPRAYAAYSRDEAVRSESSSGGIFTELARAVLKKNGAVYGAAYNEQFEVVHICAEEERDLAKLRGAKYAQSDLRGIFADVKRRLGRGQPVLFSGTPCQVAGLKAYLGKSYENLLTVDFVCHSVPSPMAWREYVKFRARQDNGGVLPERINLRDKATGWSGYQYSNLFSYGNGSFHCAKSNESLYMKLFTDGCISRESCETCGFKGYSRVSDLTIGDFWGIWEIAPEMDDNRGTSVILVQSKQGKVLFEEVKEGMILKPVSLEEAGRKNIAMLQTSQPGRLRGKTLRQIRDGKISKCESLSLSKLEAASEKITRRIKRFLRKRVVR